MGLMEEKLEVSPSFLKERELTPFTNVSVEDSCVGKERDTFGDHFIICDWLVSCCSKEVTKF